MFFFFFNLLFNDHLGFESFYRPRYPLVKNEGEGVRGGIKYRSFADRTVLVLVVGM